MLDIRRHPELVHASAWIAGSATVLGQVEIGAQSSIWFGAVVRGDSEAIEIGSQTNIQDLVCLHSDPGFPCLLGDRVTVGHGAIIHGARIADESLVGIRAVILNGAQVGKHSIVAAGALVPEGKVIPPRCLVVGTPAKVLREVTDDDLQRIQHAADHYVEAASEYQSSGDW